VLVRLGHGAGPNRDKRAELRSGGERWRVVSPASRIAFGDLRRRCAPSLTPPSRHTSRSPRERRLEEVLLEDSFLVDHPKIQRQELLQR
jgi:hypothetical protein